MATFQDVNSMSAIKVDADPRPLDIHFYVSLVHEQGTYFRFHNLARGLRELGHSVNVYGVDTQANAMKRSEDREGVHYHILPESWKVSLFSAGSHPMTALRRAMRRAPRCDVAHLFQPFLGAAIEWRLANSPVKVFDWDDRWTGGLFGPRPTSFRDRWPRAWVRHLENTLPAVADHVTVVSDYLGAMARDRKAKGISIVENGFWPAPYPDRLAARRRLGLRDDAIYVGFMGRTTRELAWCFEEVERLSQRFPSLRMAVCGVANSELSIGSSDLASRLDNLGQLSHSAARDFAAAIDLGLLPLENTDFNQSRFPIKFCEHLATGNFLLCSEIGEVGRLVRDFSWAIAAGTTRTDWRQAFELTIERLASGVRPTPELKRFAERMSWLTLSRRMEGIYRAIGRGKVMRQAV
jgi:hypothetical protein